MTRTLAIDTGGTFTDAVRDDGAVLKVASAPHDPARAIADAATKLAPDGKVALRHGTTVATNATLEGKLAPVGLIVNAGFRDVLEIGRQARPELYDPEPRRPRLPTSPRLIAEVPGRMGAGGEVLEPFDAEACRRAGRRLKRAGARSIAVVLLHAYANPDHEDIAADALAGLGLPVTTSARLNPEFREVERGLCALVNAGLRPVVGEYLERLRVALTGRFDVRVMTSEGGLLSPEEVSEEPARLLVSGPAGGLVAARAWGAAVGEPRVVTLDMGGTSTDVAWIDGELPRVSELRVAGHTIRLPSLEIHTVGAGGGSLVRLDRGGALTVGPESAGADPGPAAYGVSDEATVTDANLLLGRMDPGFFTLGRDGLDLGRAERAAQRLARRAGLTTRRLCEGIVRLADVAMTRALRVISLERGRDPRDAALMVFGGAGGLHGVALARALGMRRVIVPPNQGVLSAQGLLWAPPARTLSRSVLLDGVPSSAERRRLTKPLKDRLRALLRGSGVRAKDLLTSVALDLRYRGQSFELEVPEGADPVAAFHELHRRRFGFADPDRGVDLIAVRVRVEATVAPPTMRTLGRGGGSRQPCGRVKSVTQRASIPVHDRSDLRAGYTITGPALVAERTGTVWLDAGASARVHRTGALLVEVKP